ncbi:type VI secretion system-associated FHA domain protein TagH [Lysobacter enzymogenes]|nr:type VI secretion system-associated FHA domain protein TagH [Lysobacter enzymogenes]QCW26440.1 type VI secretion system-associated FHA domain protein TagH [Lysobacter enzymogenes]
MARTPRRRNRRTRRCRRRSTTSCPRSRSRCCPAPNPITSTNTTCRRCWPGRAARSRWIRWPCSTAPKPATAPNGRSAAGTTRRRPRRRITCRWRRSPRPRRRCCRKTGTAPAPSTRRRRCRKRRLRRNGRRRGRGGRGRGDTAPQPRRAAVDARPGLQTSEPAPAAIAIDEDFLAAAAPAVAPQRPEPDPLQALFDPPPSAAIAPVAFVGEFERPLDHPVEHPIEHPVDSTPNAPRPVPTGPQPPQHPAPAADAALFATAVAGLMDLLRARAEFKNGLRLPSTLVQRRENNPLKFAASVDEAIARLGGPTDGAYLAGEAAIEDAMRDIRHHQLALLAAMRIALEHAFAHFDPIHFDPDGGGKTALGWGGKGWRRYRERYQALRGDPDERYRVLFGDEFARAYEEQMSLMKTRDAGAHWSGTA